MLKRRHIFFIGVLALFFLHSCNNTEVPQSIPEPVVIYQQVDCTELQEQCDSLAQVILEQDNMLIKVISLFSDIQANFNSMK
jgi:hypothetical protein